MNIAGGEKVLRIEKTLSCLNEVISTFTSLVEVMPLQFC